MNQVQSFFSFVDHEVFAITAQFEGKRSGFIATWVLPASIQPGYPECLILCSPLNFTYELMVKSGRFVIHLLGDQQAEMLPALGLDSGRDFDKLAPLPLSRSEEGDLILDGVCGYAVCEVKQSFQLAERDVMIGRVLSQSIDPKRKALTKKQAFALLDEESREKLLAKQKLVAAQSLGLRS